MAFIDQLTDISNNHTSLIKNLPEMKGKPPDALLKLITCMVLISGGFDL